MSAESDAWTEPGALSRNGVLPRPRGRHVPWAEILKHVVLVAFSAGILLPLLWVLMLSIKSLPDAYTNTIWPKHFNFSHYSYAMNHVATLPQNMANSVLVTIATIVITTICAVLAGYALVHLETPGKAVVLAFLVATLFFPTRIFALIGIWEIQNNLRLLNTTYGLVLPYVTLSLALSVFIMRAVFETIPKDLADAARIDGCGPWKLLWRVMLPLVRNGVVVVIIVNFVTAWGEYLLATTLTDDQEVRTLPVVIASASGGLGQWAWPRIAAVYIMAVAPALLIFAVSQKWYMKGLQEGALKG
jgi:ABC-type glycerol-3-phosphate transport system permease component